MSFIRSLIEFVLDFLETIVVALAIFTVLYLFVFQPHQVNGTSMFPTFHNGDYLLTNKLTYRFQSPQRGDIVIFKAPLNVNQDYIKRIIGLPGDTIKVTDGHYVVNGQLLNESAYLDPTVTTLGGRLLHENTEYTVPANEYFVSGDNRANSSDSRDFLAIPAQNIIGKAWIRYWPPQDMGIVAHARYN